MAKFHSSRCSSPTMLVATATVGSADTPSNYDIASSSPGSCSALKQPGGTPGLYGLCVTFSTTVACAVAECTAGTASTLAKYNAKKKATDPATSPDRRLLASRSNAQPGPVPDKGGTCETS